MQERQRQLQSRFDDQLGQAEGIESEAKEWFDSMSRIEQKYIFLSFLLFQTRNFFRISNSLIFVA